MPTALSSIPRTGETLDAAVPHATVVKAEGEIDLTTADALRLRVLAALATHRRVAVDLSAVTFMDCAGLRALVAARLHADRSGRRVTLYRPSRPVRRLLAAARLDHTLRRAQTAPPH